MKFVDEVKIKVKAGDGGAAASASAGRSSFRAAALTAAMAGMGAMW